MGAVYKDKRSGGVVWSIRYRDVDGRNRRVRTKALNRTLARNILAQRENEVEKARLQGLPSADSLLAPPPTVTMRQFAVEFMAHARAHCTPRTADRYENMLKVHVLPALGAKTLREILPGHLQKYADDRLQGSAPATVNQELMVLSGMFREASKRGLVGQNPVALVRKSRLNNSIVRYLDPEEEARLLVVAPEPLRTAIMVAIHSGMREGEQLSLTWADVRLSERLLVLRNTKSKRDRAVPMSQTLFETVSRIPRHVNSPYVFTNPETGTRFNRFTATAWKNALKRTGISLRWHDLRHTFGSRLAQAGQSIVAIKELMGHSTIAMTMRYAHLSPSNLQAAVRALDGAAPIAKTEPESTHRSTHAALSPVPEVRLRKSGA